MLEWLLGQTDVINGMGTTVGFFLALIAGRRLKLEKLRRGPRDA